MEAQEAGEEGGKLATNIMYFGRALRAAGLPAGPGQVLDAVRAVGAAGLTRRDDFYWALHAVFVNRRDQREIFDQAFHIFWRDPKLLERMLSLFLPAFRGELDHKLGATSRRVAEALLGGRGPGLGEGRGRNREKVVADAVLTYSDREVLRKMDFEAMSAEEVRRAREAIAELRLPVNEVPSRRFRPDPRGPRIDMRASMRAGLRSGGAVIPLKHRRRRPRRPPLVLLCDISGSMSRYSQMLVHFAHALTNDRDRVYTFVFATRLTNVTRHLRNKDAEVALTKVADAVEDWSGGTRIGACLKTFNRDWSRRVLSQGAVVLFISDGLDRDAGHGLAAEIERLHKSCRRLFWLNPLLRYEGFEPKSLGVKAILPHVDDLRPVHNLEKLEQLADALAREAPRREEGVTEWRKPI
ncbi:MAG: VWA domain-containing protein [Alphaproteobacteria bacterium]